MKTKCIFCGHSFDTFPSKEKRGGGKYCGLECRSQHRHVKTMQVRVCVQCGDLYLTKRKSQSLYCSRDCSMVTFHTRRKKPAHCRSRVYIRGSEERRKEWDAKWHAEFRKTDKGIAVHRQDSALRKDCGTSNLDFETKTKFAIYHLSRRLISGRCLKSEFEDKLNRVKKGETYAAYI